MTSAKLKGWTDYSGTLGVGKLRKWQSGRLFGRRIFQGVLEDDSAFARNSGRIQSVKQVKTDRGRKLIPDPLNNAVLLGAGNNRIVTKIDGPMTS